MMRKPLALRSVGIDRDIQALEAFVCDPFGRAGAWLCACLSVVVSVSGRELVYSDPPYLQATRRSARRITSTPRRPTLSHFRIGSSGCRVR